MEQHAPRLLGTSSDFPSLKRKGTVYLDTAATSLTPEPVLHAMETYYREYRASTHRGLYASALRATDEYESVRARIATFIGAMPNEIVFTSGATAASNMLVYALEQSFNLSKGDEIVATVMEHHAALLPLQELSKRNGLTLTHIPLKDLALDYEKAKSLITERTKVVSVMLASNVLGTINTVARIAKRAHEVGAIVAVDATTAVGHLPINVHGLHCDFLYFSGHKMCGPTGVGVLYGKQERLGTLKPGYFGGGIVDEVSLTDAQWTTSPHRFEAGTPNIAGVVGLGAAVDYLTNIGMEAIHAHVQLLTSYLHDTLREVPGLTLYSAPSERNVGIVSFTMEGIHPHDIAQICADHGVAIRAGHHCAQPLHQVLGVPATARASVYLYTTHADIDALKDALTNARKVFSY